MRVLCIDAKNQKIKPYIEEGKTYTVIDETTENGHLQYSIEEVNGDLCNAERFIPCSDIDELELVECELMEV
jgi:hypothetical protein